MKNTKKWFTAAAVVALSSTLAFAAPHPGGKHGKQGGRGGHDFTERFSAKLNLSEAQKQQIRDAQTAFRNENQAFFEQTRETRRQMKEAKEAGDAARVEQLKATARSQHERMKQLREAQTQRILTLLTPEQRTQWEALKAERHSKRGGRF